MVGTHYTCQSAYNTTIQGDLTTTGGHTVDIIAGNEIEVIPSSNISPEIVLSIQPLLDYSDPMPQVDQAYVTNFCKGADKKYAAHTPQQWQEVRDLLARGFSLMGKKKAYYFDSFWRMY